MHSHKEIAFQAGVSLATVDRVMHRRAGVRAATALRVKAAIRELDRQSQAHGLDGQRLALDVVIEAPKRFTSAVRAAFEAEIEGLRPASLRVRFHLAEAFGDKAMRDLLRTIRRRGTQGLVAKLPNHQGPIEQLTKMSQAGIPVVTFVTDLPDIGGRAYIGMDNVAAGQMAAYLMQKSLPRKDGHILGVVSSAGFEGETARMDAFRAALPGHHLHLIQGEMGRDAQTGAAVQALIEQGVKMDGVYSAGGGNRAICRALEGAGQRVSLFVAHDLDADNRALLRARAIDFVIHHDLRQDARSACQHILKAHRLLPQELNIAGSAIHLATPHNMV